MKKYFIEFFEDFFEFKAINLICFFLPLLFLSVFTKFAILFFVSYVLIRIVIFSFKIYKRKKSPIFSKVQEKYNEFKKKIEKDDDGLMYDGNTVEETFSKVLKEIKEDASQGKNITYYNFVSWNRYGMDKINRISSKKHFNKVAKILEKNGFRVRIIDDNNDIISVLEITGWN